MSRRKNHKRSAPALKPSPGAWKLDWSRADHEGPFPWPGVRDPDFGMLAGMLARLNTLSLDEVMLLERAGGTSAVHQLNSMSEATDRRMQELYDSGHLSDEALEWELITITFCFEQIDARRIIVLQDSIERVIYPLWWDQNHLVSGSNGSLRAAKSCRNSRCFHGEGE